MVGPPLDVVQTSTGFNHAEGQAAGVDGPKELPSQMFDHATGYLMAFGAMMAEARARAKAEARHVRVSLAQTGRWLWNLGRIEGAINRPDLTPQTVRACMQTMPSGFRRTQRGAALRDPVEDAGDVGAAMGAAQYEPAGMARARMSAGLVRRWLSSLKHRLALFVERLAAFLHILGRVGDHYRHAGILQRALEADVDGTLHHVLRHLRRERRLSCERAGENPKVFASS